MLVASHIRVQHCPGSLVERDRFCAPLQFLLELDQEECIRRRCDASHPNPLSKEACRTLVWPAHADYLKNCVGALGNRVTKFKSPANEVRVCSEVWVIRMYGLGWGSVAGNLIRIKCCFVNRRRWRNYYRRWWLKSSSLCSRTRTCPTDIAY